MKKQIAKLINGPVGNLLLIAGAVYFVFDFFDLKITQNSEVSDNIGEESKFTADINGVIGGLEYSEIENWCREKDSNNLLSFNDCMGQYAGDTFVPEKEPDVFTLKGKTYTASRSCPDGENMYWRYKSGFMRKTIVEELGCMTASGNEAYWREYNLRQAGVPTGGGGSGLGTNMMQQQQIHNNRMNIQQNKFNQQQLQYQQNYQPNNLGGGGLTTPGGGYYYSD